MQNIISYIIFITLALGIKSRKNILWYKIGDTFQCDTYWLRVKSRI